MVVCSWFGRFARKLFSSDQRLAHQSVPLREFHFKLFEGKSFVEVDLLEFLLARAGILARRPEAAFHHELLAFLGMKVIEKEQRRVRMRRLRRQSRIADGGDHWLQRGPLD